MLSMDVGEEGKLHTLRVILFTSLLHRIRRILIFPDRRRKEIGAKISGRNRYGGGHGGGEARGGDAVRQEDAGHRVGAADEGRAGHDGL